MKYVLIRKLTLLCLLLSFSKDLLIAQSYLPYTVNIYDSSATQGYYFVAPKLKEPQPTGNKDVNMILDKFGEVVYYRAFPPGVRATDFKLQANGKMTYSNIKQFYIMDSTFTVIDSVRQQNGLRFDGHDFQILPNGNYLFVANELIEMDLSSYKLFDHHSLYGSPNAIVKCGVVQELDANKNVQFEWHTKDHFLFDETDEHYLYNPEKVDWTHCNAVELDFDGNILLSSRDFNEITKINRSDGSLMWRWGGYKNQFTFINDTIKFRTQHDIRRLANGNLTVWDNGFKGPFQPATAREYVVDETAFTATQVWKYVHDSTLFSDSRGNFQRLANGNNVVGYGYMVDKNIVFSCVKPSGAPILDIAFQDTCVSYRAFNYFALPWNLNRPTITCDQIGGQVFLSVDSGLGSYAWNTGDTTFKIEITNPGTYSVFVPRGTGGFIRSEKITISNLSIPCTPCPVLAKPGKVFGLNTPCFGTTQMYSLPLDPGSTSYTWSLPPGWIGSSSTNTITAIVGAASGRVSVVANNACGSSKVRSYNVNVSLLASKPGLINGPVPACHNSQFTYSVAPIPGVTSYNWTLPSGWSGSSTTNTINVQTNNSGGMLSVYATNGCGSGTVQGVNITIDTIIPQKPSNIAGSQTGVCGKQNVNYSVTPVSGMTYYWSFDNTNATIANGQGTHTIKVNYSPSFITGSLKVSAVNSCDTSDARSVFIKAIPKAAPVLNGPVTVCVNQQGVPYSIAPVNGANTYTWSGPTGSRFSDGINTSTSSTFTTASPSVTVNFKTTAGKIKVKGNNACGSSTNTSLTVTFNCRETNSMNSDSDIAMYVFPNPAEDKMNVSFFLKRNESYKLILADLTGRNLMSFNGEGVAGNNKSVMDVSSLSKGVYLLQLQAESGTCLLRIVVD